MSLHRRPPLPYLFVVTLALLMGSCKGATEVCDPSDPLCGPPPVVTVSSIVVTSPTVDTVMAVGRTAQLSASAIGPSGSPVSVTFTWSSSNPTTASVSASGLVTGGVAGTTSIRATASGVTGSLGMRAVNADLAGSASTLTDAFVSAVLAGIGASTASTVNGIISTCASNGTSGNVLAVNACLVNALNVGGVTGTDTALLGVLALFLEQARRQLQLNG